MYSPKVATILARETAEKCQVCQVILKASLPRMCYGLKFKHFVNKNAFELKAYHPHET